MPKKPKSLDTVLLALELLRRIPKRGKITAKTLHRQLKEEGYERDERSIQRLLKELSLHLDIDRDDREKPYGYSWQEPVKAFVAPALSEHESLLLTLAEKHLRDLLPPPLMASMESFFAQAKCNLGPSEQAGLGGEWLAKVRIVSPTQPLLPAKVDEQVFVQVSTALYKNLRLELNYRNASGHEGDYTVLPLGLAQRGPSLYLVCQFEGHEDKRSLALHRIQAARATTLRFQRPSDFDLDQYAEEGRFGFGKGERIALSFVINKGAGAHLLETPLSEDQQVKEQDESHYKITATVVDSGQLSWWLDSFGADIHSIRRKKLDEPA